MPNFKEIKTIYQHMLPRIFHDYPYTDPYFYDWYSIMTPIEKMLWIEIRSLGFPMYPQFPVGDFFLDFADPIKKINIEADGKEFHTDTEKDFRRDSILEKNGWKVYRISGSTINAQDIELSDELPNFMLKIKNENYEIIEK